MRTLGVGELKARFSEVLREVSDGHCVAVSYGRKHARVAVLVPYEQYAGRVERRLGVLEGQGSYRIGGDFAVSDEDLLS